MSKKQLDTSGITSELSGASLFFQRPKSSVPDTNPPVSAAGSESTTPPSPSSNTIYETSENGSEQSNERTVERSSERRAARKVIRHTFDIYADQLTALQGIQLKSVQNGRKKPTLGDMVQKALDLYLQKRK